MTSADINAIGYIAQGLFSSRFIIQWISSEKAGKVVAPTLFWQVSLIASFLLLVYCVLAKDISILLGQLIGYSIYVRNLRLQSAWRILPFLVRVIVILVPITAVFSFIVNGEITAATFWEGTHNKLMLSWGLLGQFIFSCRFIYQWYYSEKVKKSVLPLGFWVISIVGSILISSYSIYQGLYPIFIGHLFGMFIYSRNVSIYLNRKTKEKKV